MDSINRQQPEDNQKDLVSQEAIDKIKELSGKAKTCFFCTITAEQKFETRPMAVQEVDDQGNLWFLSAIDSHKNQEIQRHDTVTLLFQGSAHSDFLSLTGPAEISRDKEKIKQLWQPLAKTWFTEGQDDPRITVIKVTPEKGYYWDTKHNQAIAFAKQLIGAAIGKTLDDSVEGQIKV
ncbi:MAG: pyridoxamine 5'-phosphate oxidase family protein [Chitinophagales bacterium]|nr:pyridoxamine 5'-phosphate oxidase family protein [Chitinophagales bacterium]